jgi:hypothetical protein
VLCEVWFPYFASAILFPVFISSQYILFCVVIYLSTRKNTKVVNYLGVGDRDFF